MVSQIITAFLYGVVAANVILTAVVLSSGLRDLKNILFGLISLGTALWGFSIAAFYANLYDVNWILLSHSSALLIALIFYYFTLVFPRENKVNPVFTVVPLLLFLFALYEIFFTQKIIGNQFGTTYEINFGYFFYAILVSGYFFLGYVLLYSQYKNSADGSEKQQVRYVFIGSVLASFLATITDLVLPYIGFFQYTWLGPLFTLILVGSIFAAISRYRLFNVKVIATQLFVFALWIFILVRATAATTYSDQIANGLLLLLTVVVGIFLIRSVVREVKQREHIEQLAKKLEIANEQLQEMDRQKSEFVSIASHQLRSPLTAIKGYSSMLLEGSFGVVEEKAKGAIDRIFQSSQTLVAVIENFLNLSRIEQGRMSYEMAPVDARTLVKEIVDQLSINAAKKSLKLDYAIHPDGEPAESSTFIVSIDKEKIRQVIMNLLDNSIKYTPVGSVRVLLEKASPKGIRVTIADTGIGMSKVTLEKLFKKFSRADGAGKINAGGAGLGLFLAAELIQAHKGKIWAESEGEGKGSRFIIELGNQ